MKKKDLYETWTVYDLDLIAFEKILKKASLSLDLTLFLLDTEGFFLTAPPSQRPPFCKYVLDHKEGSFRCRESLFKGHKRVLQEGKSSIFSCHAGMVKITAPVWVDNRIIAVLNGCTSRLLVDGSPFPEEKFYRSIRELSIPSKITRSIESVQKQDVTQTLDLLIAMANLIAATSAENLRTLHQVDEATKHIKGQNEKLIALYDLNQILQSPLSLNEKLMVILTSLTAREGFGFNRAMLLLLNDSMTFLEGKMGVGPSTKEEALLVRRKRAVSDERPFLEKIRGREGSADREQSSFDELTRRLSFSTRHKKLLPVSALFERGPSLVRPHGRDKDRIDPKLIDVLGNTRNFVIIPLIENETPIGVIIADNRFSKRRMEKETLQMLSVFSNQAATAISNSKLYSILQEKIFQLAESNRKLHKAHTRMMQMERFSTMGTVAAGVAHEIKNPLNAIVIYLELLNKEIEKENPEKEKIAEKLNVIQQEIDRLSDLSAEFLSYGNVAPLETSPIDVRILLDQVIRFLGYQAKEQRITIRKDFPTSIPQISLNHKQMKQVFINIILNSFQAMPKGGELLIRLRKVGGKKKGLKLSFVDQGVGIPKEIQSHIFEPFFTTGENGSGLGLSFVAKVVKDHGGEIFLESQVGRGTNITLLLPLTARGLETVGFAREREIAP